MATKYCDKHEIWYDYNEGCPECLKIPRIAADIVSTVVVATVGGLILGGKKIYEKIKEKDRTEDQEEILKIEDNKPIKNKLFCNQCGHKLLGEINFCSQCGVKL